MKPRLKYAVVLVTVPDMKKARRLAGTALESRLVACANLVPGIVSHYWWKGKVERASEVLLLLKTRTDRIAALEEFILEKHPYDTPEFMVLEVTRGNKRYLNWLSESLT